MKKLNRLVLVSGLLVLAMMLSLWPCRVSANADTTAAAVQTTIDTPGSGIETVPADDVPIEQAPSSKNSNDAMMALLEFVVLWSVIYMVIKLVRKKLEKDKPFK